MSTQPAPSSTPWLPAPAEPTRGAAPELALQAGEVHIWRIPLEQPGEPLPGLTGYLSDAERARAARFYFERDRGRFIAAHAALRLILARYLERAPLAFDFQVNEYGKPHLAPGATPLGSELHFNLAHSGNIALCAVDAGGPVGVDVELIRPDFAVESIAERYFSAREVQAFRALPAALRPQGFFNAWTRKEAYIKAHGLGLSMPLNSFDVTLAPGEPAELLATRPIAEQVADWRLVALEPSAPGLAAGEYAGALCLFDRDRRSQPHLRCWQWEFPSL